jgi:hypothetical protein
MRVRQSHSEAMRNVHRLDSFDVPLWMTEKCRYAPEIQRLAARDGVCAVAESGKERRSGRPCSLKMTRSLAHRGPDDEGMHKSYRTVTGDCHLD